VNRDSAAQCGALGADILVVGSTLWKKGRDVSQEIRAIKALADGAYKDRLKKSDTGATS